MSWWILGIILVLVFLLVRFFATKREFYKAVFSVRHYQEIIELLRQLKKQAVLFASPNNEPPENVLEDPRGTVSKAGLGLFYTIEYREDEKSYFHSVSISLAGRYTAHPVGEGFIFFILHVLDFPKAEVNFAVSENSVFYLWALTDESTFEEYKTQKVVLPSEQGIKELWDKAQAMRGKVPFVRTNTGFKG